MKKLIFPLLSVLLLPFCTSTKNSVSTVNNNDTTYLIKEIKKENSWYIIYANRKDTLYKIVTKAEDNIDKNCKKIVVGERYELVVTSMRDRAPIINGVKLAPVSYTGCIQFDSKTTICLEPKRGIYELFVTDDLKGICYLK